jgi:transcription elongation GreA/GreB family factor
VISKRIIVQQIVEQLTQQLAMLAGASRAMHADASDEQNKAEDKYDTRGLETAYLASSQARLATEAEQALAAYQALELRKFPQNTPIDLTALVELEWSGERTLYFLGPKRGGLELHIKGTEVLVITPESPLAQQLIGKKTGDHIQLPGPGLAAKFCITAVS